MSQPFSFLSIDAASRSVSLDARDPAFYSDPNPVYAALHAHCPTFYWEEQKQWYFTGYDQVNALLRDRRFGRQILHVASREELGMAAPQPHLQHFDAAEAWGVQVLRPLLDTPFPARTLVNVNFPPLGAAEVQGIRVVRQGFHDYARGSVVEGTDPRGYAYYWFGLHGIEHTPGHASDLEAIADGFVAVTPLQLDLTHDASLAQLAARYAR